MNAPDIIRSRYFGPAAVTMAVIWGLMGAAGVAEACPCGCGTASPEVMFPGETWKYSLALSRQAQFKTVDTEGTLGSSNGPSAKDAFAMAISRAVGLRASVTGTIPFQRNSHTGDQSTQTMGDPTLSARYTLYMPDFTNPLIPQVQLQGAYKRSISRSIRESSDEHLMDVHGNGFNEIAAGGDVTWAMTDIKFSASALALYSQQKSFEDATYQPGPGYRLSATTGYSWIGTGQVLAIVEQETLGKLKVDSTVIDDSQKIANNIALSGSLKVGMKRTAGLQLKRTAAFGRNKNTTRSDAGNMTYTVAL